MVNTRHITLALALGAPAAAAEPAFPLDAPPAAVIRLCGAECDRHGVPITAPGGDAVQLRSFTPRQSVREGASTVGARISAYGFGIEGSIARDNDADTDRMRLGADFAAGRLSVGGGLSFDLGEERSTRGPGARLGMGYEIDDGVSVGGGVWVTEPAEDGAERDIEAVIELRLKF